MYPFWKTKTGKLVIGGCGIQVGMLFTLGGLAAIVSVCAICALVNGLSINLTQDMVQPSPSAAVGVSSPPDEVEFLLVKADFLLGELELLQTGVQTTPLPTATPVPSGKPVLMANQSGVNLRSGPGIDDDEVGLLPLGESFDIVGRNHDSSWWLVSTPDGLFAWVPDVVAATFNLNDTIPVVNITSLPIQPASSGLLVTPSPTAPPTATPTPTLPPGTPTPAAEVSRRYVEDLPTYQRVKASLLVPPVSASISPDGSRIVITERIKLYTVMIDGAHTDIWLEDDDQMGPIGGAVWSPDGQYIALVVGFKNPKCRPCRSVALLRPSDGSMAFLKAPNDLDTDAPRWTQDGRLLVNVHSGEPADGVAYVYDVFGQGREAAGVYILSTSHEGQKWLPWRPGRTWRAGVSERADSYNSD